MSDASKSLTPSESTSKEIRTVPSTNLRPLAPKPSRDVSQRSSGSDATSSKQSLGTRRRTPTCLVCLRVGCQLPTHKAYRDQSRPDMIRWEAPANQHGGSGFAASYAFELGSNIAESASWSTELDALYDLPVAPAFNTTEMRHLFHDFFTIECQNSFRLTRPREIVGDLLCGPFLMPAMRDPALCLSILTTAAATLPCRNGEPASNVISLTLFGETMQLMRSTIHSDPRSIGDNTIVAATLLWAVNAWLEDAEALKSHAESVVALVRKKGGMSKLGLVGAVSQLIRWVDILSSIILSRPCHFLDIEDPPDLNSTRNSLHGSYWSTTNVDVNDPLEKRLQSACQQSCRLIDMLEQSEVERPNAAEYSYILQKLCYLGTHDTVLRAKYESSGTINECVCTASIIVKIKCFCGHRGLRLPLVSTASSLVRAVQATGDLSDWKNHIDLLLWLLFVLTSVSTDFEGKSWCYEVLQQAVGLKLGATNANDWPTDWIVVLKTLLRCFMWSDIHLSDDFAKTCEKIGPSQMYTTTDSADEAMAG